MSEVAGCSLDHVVLGVPDLEAATASVSLALARSPSWRGRHPSYGTANVLFRLENAYLELLALDAEAVTSTAWTSALEQFLASRGGGLFSVALGTADAAGAAARARRSGLSVEDPLEGQGVNLLDGAVRRWTNARIAAESTRGTRAFFIQHLSPPEALPAAVPRASAGLAMGILGLSIESSDTDGARAMWSRAFGLAETEAEGRWRFDLGNAALLLFPGTGEEAPDRWQRVLLRTDSLTSLADRLDRERVRFEQGGFREGYGVLVAQDGADLLFLESA
jgi:catechol 2,3-dioxygenase-like lactoylglutathione lyase family enzyme